MLFPMCPIVVRPNFFKEVTASLKALALLCFCGVPLSAQSPASPPVDSSPWGIALGAEQSSRYPDFNPLLKDAGVAWIRYFDEWQHIQPKPGEWNWDWSDKFLASARQNDMSVAGVFLYFAPWASADGKNARAFPIRDISLFREYVRRTAGRYRNEVRYWEVWNEMNSPAFNKRGTTRDYAQLVRAAYEETKRIDPGIKVGLTVAAHDIRWLQQVIKDGAADHFDYVCVHPYDNVKLVLGNEPSFLSLRQSVRKMLDENKQRRDIEIWISEIGLTTTKEPVKLNRQAQALAKAYLLSVVQGFDKMFWFEAMGPKYGEGVHAIISDQNKPYPAYDALKAMTGALGRHPQYQGWLNLGGNSYGFVFVSPETGVSLAIWQAKPGVTVRFDSPVQVTDITGKTTALSPKKTLNLTDSPVFVKGIPDGLVATAKENRSKRFPWVPDYHEAEMVSAKLGPLNVENGLRQGNNDPRADGITLVGTFKGEGYRSTDLGNGRPFIYFEVDRSFMDWGDHECEITVVARRAQSDQPAALSMVYESETGYHEQGLRTFWPGANRELLPESEDYRSPEVWYMAKGEEWQEKTWRIRDANFINKWGWNFQLNVETSPGDVWVKEVQVKHIRK
jgi:polysaccharide biosynthesis protein PslG